MNIYHNTCKKCGSSFAAEIPKNICYSCENPEAMAGTNSTTPVYAPTSLEEKEALNDLIEMTKIPNANIEILMRDAYRRGITDGKELAKKKIIEAINLEK